MKIHLAVDDGLELVGGGLIVAGVFLTVGLGIALLAAAVCVIALAEFSWAGKVWSIPLPALRRRNGNSRQAKQLRNVQRNMARAVQEAVQADANRTTLTTFGEHVDDPDGPPRYAVVGADGPELFIPTNDQPVADTE